MALSPLVKILGGVALAGAAGYAYTRSQNAAAVAFRASGMPRYDVGLPDAIANKIDVMLGRVAGTPGEKDPAKVTLLSASLDGSKYPIAVNALNLYAKSLGGLPMLEFPVDSSPSSGGILGGLTGLFGGGGSSGASSPSGGASSSSPAPVNVRVSDVKSAQSALVAWNGQTGLGGDFGRTSSSDVDGIAGPRSLKAAVAFVAWLAVVGGPVVAPTFSSGLYSALQTWANGGYSSSPVAAAASAASSIFGSLPGLSPSPAPSPAPAPAAFVLSPALLASLGGRPPVGVAVPPPNRRTPGGAVAAPTAQTLLGAGAKIKL